MLVRENLNIWMSIWKKTHAVSTQASHGLLGTPLVISPCIVCVRLPLIMCYIYLSTYRFKLLFRGGEIFLIPTHVRNFKTVGEWREDKNCLCWHTKTLSPPPVKQLSASNFSLCLRRRVIISQGPQSLLGAGVARERQFQ